MTARGTRASPSPARRRPNEASKLTEQPIHTTTTVASAAHWECVAPGLHGLTSARGADPDDARFRDGDPSA